MWSLNPAERIVVLSSDRITLTRPARVRLGKIDACEHIDCSREPAGTGSEAWQPALETLTHWLVQKSKAKLKLHVLLSGRFVRWQLLPWQDEVSRPKEIETYASLRFSSIFGKAASSWQVTHSPPRPGLPVPACAVDATLISALRKACDEAGVSLTSIEPYFSFEFDRLRSSLHKKAAWFGLIESDCVSLGLLRAGQWLGLRSQRIDGEWRDVLPGMMAQLGIAVGLKEESVPLFLTGGDNTPTPTAGLAFTWLESKTQNV